MTTTLATWEHKGQTITVDADGAFRTSLDTEVGDEHKSYASRQEAQDSVDRILTAQAKEARTDIALAALTSDGIPYTITGVRRGSGSLLVTPKLKGYSDKPEYPDTPQVRALIRRSKVLEDASSKLYKLLQTTIIGGSPYGVLSYSQQSDADYPAAIAKLKADYAKALAVAQALPVEGEAKT